jgi:nucleotide-binding universal stress UspA family protein
MRILLATDGSNEARAAAEWLRDFPLPADTSVLVVTVMHPGAVPAEVKSSLEADAYEVVETARRIVAERFPNAEGKVLPGDPRTTILQLADEWRADVVAMGARGLGAFAGMVLGSVSSGVARHSKCSVLVTKGSPRNLRLAMAAVDGSSDALSALRTFCALPLPASLRVRLLAVAERPYYPSTAPGFVRPMISAAINDIIRERTTELEKLLVKLEGECQMQTKGPKGPVFEHQVVVGNPTSTVVEEVNRSQADLVVVGARGLGAFQRVLLGSVSESVMHNAACPILIVKTGAATS